MGSKNESKLKKIRKTSFLLSQKESSAEQVKKYLCLFDKIKTKCKDRIVKKCLENCGIEIHCIEDGVEYITQFIS